MEHFDSVINNIQQPTVVERSSVVDVGGVWLRYVLCSEKFPVSARHNNVDMITNHNYSINHYYSVLLLLLLLFFTLIMSLKLCHALTELKTQPLW